MEIKARKDNLSDDEIAELKRNISIHRELFKLGIGIESVDYQFMMLLRC